MEPAVSLPCLHNPAVCPYAELHESGSRNPILFLIDHCNSIFRSAPRSVNRTRFLSPNQNSVVVLFFPTHVTCHVLSSDMLFVMTGDFIFHFREVRKCRNIQKASAESAPLYVVKVMQMLN